MALPLAMAFAIASGLTPQAGIYCAVVTGFLISALGGSKTQIGGPTGAFVVVVAGIVAVHGIDGLYMCTVMAGAILIVLGATGMGTAVKFIPRPVVIGFTNGIAVLIASTQIKDFFGLQLDKVPSEFWLRMKALFHAAPTFSLAATLLAAGTVADDAAVPRHLQPDSGRDHRHAGRDRGRVLAQAAGGNHRHALWRNSQRPASFRDSALARQPGPRPARTGLYGGHAGSDRVADVGGGFRPHEQRSPQSQRRTDRTGNRQHLLADVRRLAGHGRHRAHRNQYPRPERSRRSRA